MGTSEGNQLGTSDGAVVGDTVFGLPVGFAVVFLVGVLV